MADVITRFKLETTQYDSKLRDASKGLQAYGKQIETAGKDFTNFSQKAVEAARSLGTIASGATNTKDKLRDLVGAYNDVAKTYNKLTEQQRQTDFGKAMSQSLEQLQVRIKETKDELYGLSDAVKGKGGGLFGEGGMTGALQVFGGNMLTKGVEMLTSELADAWSQSIELAKSGEGVRIAFERLNQPGLLEKLKEATHGTVSEVELMKQAIQFENFKLPLEDLTTYLAFAQQKAKDTGQSVDYLVNSIVTGLGRQSKQILDNLGISASELTKRMNEGADMTKAVADIIREEMAKAGDYVETAADRAARATADAQNQMEEFGRSAAPLAEAFTSMWNDIKNGALDVANTLLGPLANSILSIQNILNTTLDDRRIAMFDAFEKLSQQQQSQSGYKGMGNAQMVTAPGGYVEVTDSHTGEIIGGKHFDNTNDLNAIKDWRKSLFKKSGGSNKKTGKTKTVKTEEQLNNENIQKLTQEYIKASDDRRKAIEGEIKTLQDRNAEIKRLMEAAQGKAAPDGSLKALSEELSKLQQERQLLSDPIDIELHDQAIKDVQDEIDRLNGKKVEVELEVDNRTPFEKLKDSLKIEIAEENMQVDTTTLQTLMKTAIQNGIDGLDPQFASLQEKMRMNIPDSAWEDLQTQINEKLKELGIEPIKIDFKTGNIAKDGKDVAKEWNSAANAISSVGSAMQSIEDPSAKIVGTIAQAIATIALTYAQSLKGTFTPWDWIAGAASGMATMMSVISAIHSATGYSEGGMIKGNSYSGDLIPANGGMIGLNAGEVVLNRAQQNTLASELQGSGGGSDRYMPSFVSGEQIWIALNAYTKRTGRGELVTWR